MSTQPRIEAAATALFPASGDIPAVSILPAKPNTTAKEKPARKRKAQPKNVTAKKTLAGAEKKPSAKRRARVTSIAAAKPMRKQEPTATVNEIVPISQVEEFAPSPAAASEISLTVCEAMVEQVPPTVPEIEPMVAELAAAETPLPIEEFALVEDLPAYDETLSLDSDLTPGAEITRTSINSDAFLHTPQFDLKTFRATVMSLRKLLTSFAAQAWTWVQQKLKSHQVRKRLRVCETVSLGEKRFVAVIQVDGQQFLVGGSSSSVTTLARLETSQEFSDVLQRQCEQDLGQA